MAKAYPEEFNGRFSVTRNERSSTRHGWTATAQIHEPTMKSSGSGEGSTPDVAIRAAVRSAFERRKAKARSC